MQERTEKPTQRKLKKAREKGDVAHSVELTSALIFFGALLLLWGLASFFENRFQQTFLRAFSSQDLTELTQVWKPLIYPTLLLLIGLFLTALASHRFQTGWIWSWSRSKKQGGFRFIFPLLKLSVITAIVYLSFRREKPDIHLLLLTPSEKVVSIFKKVYFLLLKISIALLFLGMCDFIYQKWKHFKRMHMTPQELKEEKRETEGSRASRQ